MALPRRDRRSGSGEECFRVLWQAFKGDVLPTPPAASALSGAALALEIATAVPHLARQQLDLEQRHNTMADYLRGFVPGTRRTLAGHEDRIGALEIQLSAGATISETQAAEIALAVKNVANALDGVGISNPYARVYSEMYRLYHVSSYKNLPAARYEEVRAWLAGWYDCVFRPEKGRRDYATAHILRRLRGLPLLIACHLFSRLISRF